MSEYKDKLNALLEGLEVQHIEDLMENATVEHFKLLGETMADHFKRLSKTIRG